MKHLHFLTAFAFFSSVTFAADVAQFNSPHISVSGTARMEVVPDSLVWTLQLKNTGLELAKAAEKHAGMSASLLKTLRELGIEEKNLQSSQMEFGENIVFHDNRSVKEGHFASTEIIFKLVDLNKYKEIWVLLSAINHLSVESVTYDHSKRIELQKETRQKALLAAKEKAAAMAETLGSKIGDVISIEEDSESNERWYQSLNPISNTQANPAIDADDVNSSIACGTIPIRIRVLVNFRLLNDVR